jgi:hypothetical protein
MAESFLPGKHVQIHGSSTFWRVVGVDLTGAYTLERDANTRRAADRALGVTPLAQGVKIKRITRYGVPAGKLRAASFRKATR